jgi:hypothetical protein
MAPGLNPGDSLKLLECAKNGRPACLYLWRDTTRRDQNTVRLGWTVLGGLKSPSRSHETNERPLSLRNWTSTGQ